MADQTLDVERLERELRDISRQRYEMSERIPFVHAAGGRDSFNPLPPRGPPPLPPGRPRDLPAGLEASGAPQQRLASVVVVGAALSAPEPRPASHTKRDAPGEPLADKPEVKRRNQRLFGTLMGTLQKFQEEESRVQSSEVAQRRAAALEAAEQRSREAAEAAKREVGRLRGEGDALRRRLNRAEREKRLELAYARRLAQREREDQFLRTAACPPILWAPVAPCSETEAALAAQRAAAQRWRAQQLEALEAEKAKLPGDVEADGGTENGGQHIVKGREDRSGMEGDIEAAAVVEPSGGGESGEVRDGEKCNGDADDRLER